MNGLSVRQSDRTVGLGVSITPRLEPLDDRILPGGLAGGVLTSGAFFARFDLERPDHISHSDRISDSSLQLGGTTDGVHVG
jgi:hypothetical protein